MPASYTPSTSELEILDSVIRGVARRSCLLPEDADDFVQTAHLSLLARNYAPLAQFSGRSSLRTFLTVVVQRLLLDWRNARYGKWRPSARAQSLGPVAIALERLISRDGHSVAEAIAILGDRRPDLDSRTLQSVADQLPARARAVVVALDEAADHQACPFDDPIQEAEDAERRRHSLARLRHACRGLTAEDQQLLRWRFEEELTVANIATRLGVPAKPLYRRLQQLYSLLRERVTTTGETLTAGSGAVYEELAG